MTQFLHSFAQLAETPEVAGIVQRANLRRRADYAKQVFGIYLLHKLPPGTWFRFINADGKPGVGTYVAGAVVHDPNAIARQVRSVELGHWFAAKANSRVIVRD